MRLTTGVVFWIFLSQVQCQSCSQNCITCIDANNCTECVDGYYNGRWYDDTHYPIKNDCSIKCNEKLKNCSACSSYANCSKCKAGYCNSGEKRNCENLCIYGCKTCSPCAVCTSCIPWRYGRACNMKCGKGCLGGTCELQSGNCNCSENFHGAKCDTCIAGKYGRRCDLDCPKDCSAKTCDKVSGNCHTCSGDKCDTSCNPGKYGLSCSKNCPKGCKGNTCDKETGRCTLGCQDRYKPPTCNTCMDGFFGEKCLTDCPGNCIGKCQENGLCVHGCVNGQWGELCDKTCASNCLTCNQSNGDCFSCFSGTYGVNCSQNCIVSCAANCDKNSGECISGCEKNRYGTYCEKKCSLNCWNEECDWETGHCSSGCVHGFSGSICDIPCSKNCKNNSCNWLSGDCNIGCLEGFEGRQCTEEAVARGNVLLPVGIGVGTFLVALIVSVWIVLYINHRKRKNGKPDMKRTEIGRSENSNNDVVGLASGGKRNSLLIEDTGQGYIYTLPYKPGKELRPKSATERKVIVTVEVEHGGRSQECQATGLQGAEYANIRNEHTSTDDEKRTNASNDDVEQEEYFTDDDEHKTTIAKQDGDDPYYNTATVLKRRIKLDKLAEFVSNKTKEDFMTEFKTLPVGLIKAYEVSQKTENRTKNRYRGVFPYDSRRVVIKTGCSDYINASYIDGYLKRNAYIASIGPTAKHMGDDFVVFWEMIWQENVGTIVMLTKLNESGTPKCDKYWPDMGSRDTYGNLQVICRKEDIHTHFTTRTFSIENVNNKNERRTLHHMHFTSWPDKGVPEKVSLLTDFHEQATTKSIVANGPVIVHCSAGVGRTGTYIALDMLTNEGRAEGHVDIFACVRNLREERINMVQTVEQYIYLHECLVHLLKNPAKKKGGKNVNK